MSLAPSDGTAEEDRALNLRSTHSRDFLYAHSERAHHFSDLGNLFAKLEQLRLGAVMMIRGQGIVGGCRSTHGFEGGECRFVLIGQCVEVVFGCADCSMTKSLFDDQEVCPASE